MAKPTGPAAPATSAAEAPAPVEAAVVAAPARRAVPVKLLVAILAPIVGVGVIATGLFLHRQMLVDQWNVWNYETTPAIAQYVNDSTMTNRGLFLFTANKPRVAPNSEFNSICGSHEGGDGVLGCYSPDTKRITLFEITDSRLAGLQEAVASHEMLHAAWDRLGDGQRAHLTALLDAEVERLGDDEVFQDQLDAYYFDDDAARADELHSLIGTEVTGVSAELERYYSQYFTDRDALVALYTEANGVLIEITEQVQTLNDELDALDKEIKDSSDQYDAGIDKLNNDIDAFNARNNAYYYKSQRAFDADRNRLVARSKALDKLFDEIQGKIDEYNAKLDELTDLDAQAAELFSSINLDRESVGL